MSQFAVEPESGLSSVLGCDMLEIFDFVVVYVSKNICIHMYTWFINMAQIIHAGTVFLPFSLYRRSTPPPSDDVVSNDQSASETS